MVDEPARDATEPAPSSRSGIGPDGEWTPAFPGQRRPFEVGHPGMGGAPPKHGAYSETELEPLRVSIDAALADSSPAYAESDDHARRSLANQYARIELVHRWLETHGVVDEKGGPWPILVELVKWENGARKEARELGMTTLSRVQIDLDRLQAREMVARAEVTEALRSALELAVHYLPREQVPAYLVEVRALLTSQPGAVDDENTIEGEVIEP